MTRLSVWIVGDWRHVDFTPALLWLQERACCRRFEDGAAALEVCLGGDDYSAPHAVLLVAARPGQIAAEDVEALHRHMPLARLVALVGPWCEGELRSGRPLPGVVRVPWRHWPTRLAGELGLDQAADPPLPRTASDTERLARSVAGLKRRRATRWIAAVCAADRVRYESLRDTLLLLGIRSQWQWPSLPLDSSAVDLVFVDGWENWPAAELEADATREFNRLPHVLLLDFPRPDDEPRAKALGARAILAEPILLADLASVLDAVLPAALVRGGRAPEFGCVAEERSPA